ncbi:O-methyltransferase [Anaerorhabdus sp.]|jgi:predicted O-methyltransferase YrrM|uniref:O-methyltransferase n=1 Tax=Anaerorhabdus sp. TaxID=1872524 RepID=UPI002FC721D1
MIKIDEMKEYAKENHVPIMQDGGIEFLCKTILENKCQSILECGTAIGYSSIKMANLDSTITIDTCEIKSNLVIEARKNIANAGLSNRIHVHECDAAIFQSDKKYDLIFVDAAKAQYKKYMDHFLGNLNQNGMFVFDNLSFHGMVENPDLATNRNTKQLVKKIKKFVEYICNDPNLETHFYPNLGDGVAIVKLK